MHKITTRTQLVTSISHIWLVLWLVAIPLIHIHPEADHAHGSQTHQHGGLLHSVLSQDLACEFHQHSTLHDSPAQEGAKDFSHCEHTQTHLVNHDEIGFSLLSASSDDFSASHQVLLSFLASPDQQTFKHPSDNHSLSSERSPPLHLHRARHHIRPPPTYST